MLSVVIPNVVILSAMAPNTRPGDCIIKLITAVIYGFCNKLECSSLASLSSLVQCLGTNSLAYYGRNKFYDTKHLSFFPPNYQGRRKKFYNIDKGLTGPPVLSLVRLKITSLLVNKQFC
jgi:hypothetical protein